MMGLLKYFLVVVTFYLLGACDSTAVNDEMDLTAIGKPEEGALDPFMAESFFKMDVVFQDGSAKLREPYLAVAVDGTILAMRNRKGHLRRSEDGGKTWGEIIEVPFGFLDSNFIIDENTGDIIVIRLWEDTDKQWRSKDHGKTWREENLILKPNGIVKWLNQTGLMKRVSWRRQEKEQNGNIDTYTLHSNASESGITLRHGGKKR
ncbi:sialidase family protein [Membranihabitans marinus]|uniref:sialidase family protein n=1 Tax=Membranihabitans marinus TaxID=1227546 RepID=UPI001F35B527|nr:sialidase family protein [Membranihabitans marinus]